MARDAAGAGVRAFDSEMLAKAVTKARRGKGAGKWSSVCSTQVLRRGSHVGRYSGYSWRPTKHRLLRQGGELGGHGFNQSGSDEHANHHLIATRPTSNSTDLGAVVVVVRAFCCARQNSFLVTAAVMHDVSFHTAPPVHASPYPLELLCAHGSDLPRDISKAFRGEFSS